ncbi:MAG: CDP-glucose 4,6-dehydratase [Coleofasciculaceae cyanobacterium SM2_1_6]|nr:CDP-glucose 4,6-dehydratase [Coleofasciculaceae cyanobacterium SM2_1_6]
MVINSCFWRDKKVLITGHTGFKGSWLSLWLQILGVELLGYSLPVPTQPSLYDLALVGKGMTSIEGDIRDLEHLSQVIKDFQPEIVFHMAAQPLVRHSYANPVETYSVNVMGTVHLLEAVRQVGTVRSLVNITSDKCYENREWVWGYREQEPMGGYDPYSSSKGCAELVTAAYRNSFFPADSSTAIATARAGNVIGGGDWSLDRLIPDILRAITNKQTIIIRNPQAIRPWQHVLDPLTGYLLLAEKLYQNSPQDSDQNLGRHLNQGHQDFRSGWNFGGSDRDTQPVAWIVDKLLELWGDAGVGWECDQVLQPHEANYLKLDCSKAKTHLDWEPQLDLTTALAWVVTWTKAWDQGADMRDFTKQQILKYVNKLIK